MAKAKRDEAEIQATCEELPDMPPEEVVESVKNGKLKAGIRSITVGGITLGEETLSHFGADELVSDIVSSAINAEYGQKVEITDLSISESISGGPILKLGIKFYIAK